MAKEPTLFARDEIIYLQTGIEALIASIKRAQNSKRITPEFNELYKKQLQSLNQIEQKLNSYS